MALNMDWLKHTTMVEDDLLPTLWKQLIDEFGNFIPAQNFIETQQFTVAGDTVGLPTGIDSLKITNYLERKGTDIINANCRLHFIAKDAATLNNIISQTQSSAPFFNVNNKYLKTFMTLNNISYSAFCPNTTTNLDLKNIGIMYIAQTVRHGNIPFSTVTREGATNNKYNIICIFYSNGYFDTSLIPAEKLIIEEAVANDISAD